MAKRAVSIKTTIVRPMFVILFFQVVIVMVTVLLGDTTNQLKNNAYELLSNRNNKVSYNVNSFFSHFKIGDSNYNIVNNRLKEVEKGQELADLALADSKDTLLSIMEEANASGVFVILNDIANKSISEKSGVYIRKNSEDLELKVASYELIQNLGIKTDNSWREMFKFGSNDIVYADFYNEAYTKAKKNKELSYRECEYLSEPFDLNNSDVKSITYTLPLINGLGEPYGVIGVEISLDKLSEILNSNTEGGTHHFIVYGNEKGLKGVSLTKDDYKVYDISLLQLVNSSHNVYKMSPGGSVSEDKVAAVKDLGIKIGNDKIKVLSIVRENDLFNIQSKLMKDLIVALIVSFIFGIIIVLFTASYVTKPITKMVNAVKRMNPSKAIKIDRLGITQMDALAVSIENLGKNVSDNASKLSQIINLVNMPIGAFEYFDNSNMVYCTQSFFKVVGVESKDEENLFINMERFKKILSDITKDRVKNEKNVYCIKKFGKDYYIRVKMLISELKTLGVVVDVTDDILKKQKIEYERDHDVLTGLFNRIAFKREVTNYISNAPKDKIAAFLMWDLDSLKYMNDTFGHELGDEYIRMAADAISKFTKYGGISGRIGGDEFTAFIGGFNTKDEIRQIINKVKRDFEETEIKLPNGERKNMRASMGVAWFPQDSKQYEELNKYADYAMYEVKKTTKGALKEFDIRSYAINGDYNKYE